MDQIERAYLGSLSQVGFEARHFVKAFTKFEKAQEIWMASESELLGADLPPGLVERFKIERENIEPQKYFDNLIKNKIGIISIFDKNYPENLKDIKNPPYVLFVKGEVKPDDAISVAIVGTRKPSSYGKRITLKLASELAANGVCVISGLAYGVDGLGHRGALDGGGRTIAVLGSGIDQIQPVVNYKLAEEIIAGQGAVISEYPLGTPGRVQNFPARNRIVSGLSQAVLVIEGAEGSGTLITADFAKKQGKILMAVPGEIDNPMSVAPNGLIAEGAVMVTKAGDILSKLKTNNEELKTTTKNLNLDKSKMGENEKRIYESLTEPMDLGRLSRVTKISVGELTGMVTMMELSGILRVENGVVMRAV